MYTTKNGRHGSELFPQIDRVLNEIFNTTISHATDEKKSKYSQPTANVKEFKDRFEIYLAVPGLEKNEISMRIAKNILTISSEKEVQEEGKVKLQEFKYGSFSRKFTLPQTLDLDTVVATLTNGILKVAISKRKDAIDKGPKEITVN